MKLVLVLLAVGLLGLTVAVLRLMRLVSLLREWSLSHERVVHGWRGPEQEELDQRQNQSGKRDPKRGVGGRRPARSTQNDH